MWNCLFNLLKGVLSLKFIWFRNLVRKTLIAFSKKSRQYMPMWLKSQMYCLHRRFSLCPRLSCFIESKVSQNVLNKANEIEFWSTIYSKMILWAMFLENWPKKTFVYTDYHETWAINFTTYRRILVFIFYFYCLQHRFR